MIDRLAVAVCAGVLESLTRIPKVAVPGAVGVPDIWPAEFNERPAGSDPLMVLNVYGEIPPEALMLAV